MSQSIKKFAIDYRQISPAKWNLPYIRLGGNGCDSAINIGSSIENDKYNPSMSELDKIWWVWRHIEEFGKTDYFGFCHWRRFFSIQIQQPILNITWKQFNSSMCLDPETELQMIVQQNAIGASFSPIYCSNKQFIWEQMNDLEKDLPIEINKKMFDIMLDVCPSYLKDNIIKSFQQKRQYVCNIFTLQTTYFCELCDIMFKTLTTFDDAIPNDVKRNFHPRYLGYYGERIVSCYLYALQYHGLKIIHFPLLTIDANKHNKVEINSQTGFKYEVK